MISVRLYLCNRYKNDEIGMDEKSKIFMEVLNLINAEMIQLIIH